MKHLLFSPLFSNLKNTNKIHGRSTPFTNAEHDNSMSRNYHTKKNRIQSYVLYRESNILTGSRRHFGAA